MEGHENGWPEWKNHVLAELHRLNVTLESHTERDEKLTALISTLKVDIATLKTKSGIWGSMAGFIAASLVSIGLAFLGK